MILTQQPLYAANTHDPFGVSNCDATRVLVTLDCEIDIAQSAKHTPSPNLREE